MIALTESEKRLKVEFEQRLKTVEATLQSNTEVIAVLQRLFDDTIWVLVSDRYGEGGSFSITSGRNTTSLPVGQWSVLSRMQFQEGIDNAVKIAARNPANAYTLEVKSFEEMLAQIRQQHQAAK
jgi:hypothetical protein